mmetsp:Transcript_27835/g.70349  ORF Transcript_27835/g.70349 Transcript_27835/m.70349 type:complete len:640 (-) Transcript_27835:309-2228(-)
MEYYGLDSRPDQDEIQLLYPSQKLLKAKYRELVRVHHPDKKGEKEEFQRIDAAYRELNRLYDEQTGNFKYKPKKSEAERKSKSGARGTGNAAASGEQAPAGGASKTAAGRTSTATAGAGSSGTKKNDVPPDFDPFESAGPVPPGFDPFETPDPQEMYNKRFNFRPSSPGYDEYHSAASNANSPDPHYASARAGKGTKMNWPPSASQAGAPPSSAGPQQRPRGSATSMPASTRAGGEYEDFFAGVHGMNGAGPYTSFTRGGSPPAASPTQNRSKMSSGSNDFPETRRNYDDDSSSLTNSDDDSNSALSEEDHDAGATSPSTAPGGGHTHTLHRGGGQQQSSSEQFRVLEVIVMGFRSLEKAGSYKVEIALDGRAQQMMGWAQLPSQRPGEVFYPDRVENFTFFRWHSDSYLQVILHGQRTFRMNKREGESHISIQELRKKHRGRFEGWIVLEHKNKKIGEVLLAIDMESATGSRARPVPVVTSPAYHASAAGAPGVVGAQGPPPGVGVPRARASAPPAPPGAGPLPGGGFHSPPGAAAAFPGGQVPRAGPALQRSVLFHPQARGGAPATAAPVDVYATPPSSPNLLYGNGYNYGNSSPGRSSLSFIPGGTDANFRAGAGGGYHGRSSYHPEEQRVLMSSK